jgi:hypothetical protein
MALNRDGLEVGQPVDFETMMRIKRQQKAGDTNGNSTEEKPKRGRRKSVRTDSEHGVSGASSTDAQEEA